MLQSLRISNLILRVGLALVFFWFGIDKFIHPQYWSQAWISAATAATLGHLGLTAVNLIWLLGIIQILIAVSIVSTLFMRFFSGLAIVLVALTAFAHGFNEVLVRDIGLIGSLLALIFWPDRHLG